MILEATSRPPNGSLSALNPDDYELVRPFLRSFTLAQDLVLIEAGDALTRAVLPHHGVISLVVNLAKGERVQAAMIGRHSILGALAALGDQTALDSAVVLVPGTASTLDLDRLRVAAERSPNMRSLLVRHGLALHAQILHAAGCNAVHTVESRLARCLSQTHDLSGDFRLDLTQEALAQMIGARRNSVSLVASTLQQSNFIRYSRGRIDITNLDGLRTTACECYPAVKAQYERLLGARAPS